MHDFDVGTCLNSTLDGSESEPPAASVRFSHWCRLPMAWPTKAPRKPSTTSSMDDGLGPIAADAEILKKIAGRAGTVGDVVQLGIATYDWTQGGANRNEELGNALGSVAAGSAAVWAAAGCGGVIHRSLDYGRHRGRRGTRWRRSGRSDGRRSRESL